MIETVAAALGLIVVFTAGVRVYAHKHREQSPAVMESGHSHLRSKR